MREEGREEKEKGREETGGYERGSGGGEGRKEIKVQKKKGGIRKGRVKELAELERSRTQRLSCTHITHWGWKPDS